MATTTYRVDVGFDRFDFRADLAQASAPIEVRGEDGWTSSQYQTADARHRVEDAAALVLQSFGRDYYLAPGETCENPDEYCRGLIKSVREVDAS